MWRLVYRVRGDAPCAVWQQGAWWQFASRDGDRILAVVEEGLVEVVGDGRRRVTDPRAAVERHVVGDPGLVEAILARMARAADAGSGVVSEASPASRIIGATWPLLRTLQRFGAGPPPERVPDAVAHVLVAADPAVAAEAWLAHGRRHRPTERTLGELVAREDGAGLPDVALLRVARGLEPDVVVRLASGAGAGGLRRASLAPSTADRAQGVLAGLGARRHAELVAEALATPVGPSMLRRIGEAGHDRLDLDGVRDLRHLVERATEALADVDLSVDARRLAGQAVPGTDLTLRVAMGGSGGELRHASARMDNCLHTYVGGVAPQDAIVLAVGAGGEYRHAVELVGGRIVQWEGPGNRPPDPRERGAVEGVLRDFGVLHDVRGEVGRGDRPTYGPQRRPSRGGR